MSSELAMGITVVSLLIALVYMVYSSGNPPKSSGG